jgi:haloalkane dehalogenase
VYRQQITALVRAGYRVVAPDHLGFGLSEQPRGAGYRPEDHARRLDALLTALDVRDITLVVHDFGGPIGLACAIAHPERVSRLVVLNSWLWSLHDDPRIVRASRIASGIVGRFLYTRLNASPRWLIPRSFADKRALSASTHAHYLAPFPTAPSRLPLWILARALLGSSDWHASLWEARDRLASMRMLLLWGMRDPAFGPAYLARFVDAFPTAHVQELPSAGHFVQEEAADQLSRAIIAHLEGPARVPAVAESPVARRE